jgi:hypothetical protein
MTTATVFAVISSTTSISNTSTSTSISTRTTGESYTHNTNVITTISRIEHCVGRHQTAQSIADIDSPDVSKEGFATFNNGNGLLTISNASYLVKLAIGNMTNNDKSDNATAVDFERAKDIDKSRI